MCLVLDNVGKLLKEFKTKKEARNFCTCNGRYDWTIISDNKSTKRQQAAVRYCEQWLYVEFDGDINSFEDCSYFLSLYLDEAKQTERELFCEYEAYIWSLD